MKYDEMGNPAFYLVEQCGACSEPLYILGGNHRDHGGGTLFGQQGGFLYSCSFGSRKILIHGNSWNLFYVFWLQVNKFQIDLN